MRVAHLIRGLEAGGAEMTLTRMVLGAAVSDPEVDHSIFVFEGGGRLESRLRESGIDVGVPGTDRSRDPGVISIALSLARNRPDLIQGWMQRSCVAAGAIGRILHIPVIWTLRMSADPRGARRLPWLLTKLMCGPLQWMPHAIVACSDEVASSHRALGLRRDLVVIENGVVIADLTSATRSSARARFRIPPGAFVVGRAARWDPAKDFPTLLDAARIVVDTMPHVVFLLVGRGVDEANRELVDGLTARGIEEHFLLIGEQRDMTEFYAACDIVCSSSSTEGFPNTVLEALAAGIPVVATDVGASSRIIGDTGWLVPPSDPEALGAALIEAASTPAADLAERAEYGRARVSQEFSSDRMIAAYHDLYKALLPES